MVWRGLVNPDRFPNQDTLELLFPADPEFISDCAITDTYLAACRIKNSDSIKIYRVTRSKNEACIDIETVRSTLNALRRRTGIRPLVIDGAYIRQVDTMNNDVAEAIMGHGFDTFLGPGDVVFSISPSIGAVDEACLEAVNLYSGTRAASRR